MLGLKKKEKKKENETILSQNKENERDLFSEQQKSVKQLISVNGCNPNIPDYTIIEDCGTSLYTMGMYIDKIPKTTVIASTYSPLFNFEGATGLVFIDPVSKDKASSRLDKRIDSLEVEQTEAERSGNRNRFRRITRKMNSAEKVADAIESGDDMMFEVGFLFILQNKELDRLRITVNDFYMLGKEKGIELTTCYGSHLEAFMMAYPFNRVRHINLLRFGGQNVYSLPIIRMHTFDKGSVIDLFNHTKTHFSHSDGIPLGHNLSTGQLFCFDPYDKSHDGYGIVISGKTGSGKSATLKMINNRLIETDVLIRSVDFESRGKVGEYGISSVRSGGFNFRICKDPELRLNPYHINKELIYDEITQKEYWDLDLSSKLSNLQNLFMVLVRRGKSNLPFDQELYLETIIMDINVELYRRRRIYDHEPDSLYEQGSVFSKSGFVSGLVKKHLPTIHEFYVEALRRAKKGEIPEHQQAYRILLDAMKEQVEALYYCGDCEHDFSPEEIKQLEERDGAKLCPHCHKPILEIHGVRAYFDGETLVEVDNTVPHINLDISSLNKNDKIVALLFVMDYLQEEHIKKNSMNPKVCRKMLVEIDELHKTFPYKEAVLYVSDWYRTCRKRNVSPVAITQSAADFDECRETRSIFKNSAVKFLFKHEPQDEKYLIDATPLTETQRKRVFNLAYTDPNATEEEENERRGETCIIDGERVIFIKVDYLKESEAMLVETDVNKIAKMYQGKIRRNLYGE